MTLGDLMEMMSEVRSLEQDIEDISEKLQRENREDERNDLLRWRAQSRDRMDELLRTEIHKNGG
jgi:hypothetical protein